jgi:NAD(P)-dependent dehydrogenase (short-subunit alcohol dehydrogenase family)
LSNGISVFSISPGLVRTAMTESIARSSDDEKWFGGSFGKSFAAGHDVPPERAADLVVLSASGQADALSGCYIGVGSEDPFEMMQRAEEIQQDELYTLRLRT